MTGIVFHPDVAVEIKASYSWYQNQAVGLGDDFISELESAYQTIQVMPDTWPKFQRGSRRFLLRRFPFSVIYRATNDTIFILAKMHNSRKTGYWSKRSEE